MAADDIRGPLADEVFAVWLTRFGATLDDAAPERLATCFVEDGYWKDLLAFGWEF